MDLIIYTVVLFFWGLLGMISVLIVRFRKEQKEGTIERGESETLVHFGKKVFSKAIYGVKDTVTGDTKELLASKTSKFNVIGKHVAPKVKKLQDTLHGRTKVVREASSLYLQDIKEHKTQVQKRLKGAQESFLD